MSLTGLGGGWNGAGTSSGTAPIGGGGVLNYLSKFTPDGTTIGNSLVFDNGTSVGIGTAVPDASSLLDISSTTHGFLSPRMTQVQRDAIVAPATGLFIYNTTSSKFNFYDGATWVAMGTATVAGKFAYFWQSVSNVSATIPQDNGKVLFQTSSPSNTAGITTVAASGDITIGVGAGGIYKVSQFVAGAEPNAFAIFINGAKAAGTVYGSGTGTQQNGGFSILVFADNDVVSLRSDLCPAAITLQLAGTTDSDQIVGSIMFERLA